MNLKNLTNKKFYLNFLSQPKKNPLIILGNEKSGTTVIAATLAKAIGENVTLDIPEIWNPVQRFIHNDLEKLTTFINKNPYPFSKCIIKEPVLTFEYHNLLKIFPGGKFLLIIRDPRDNIRSILNRLNLPGNLDTLNNLNIDWNERLWKSWSTVLYNDWLFPGQPHKNYIHSMSLRWQYISDLYFNNSDKIFLIKYEDFLDDKVAYIESLCRTLGFSKTNNFKSILDKQFQPKGDNSNTWLNYFGQKNLETINDTCMGGIKRFAYQL